MKNHDDQGIDPDDDIFEEIEPAEPDSLDARIRAGEEIDPDELEDEDWDSQQNHLEHLEDLRQAKPQPPGESDEAKGDGS